jgi:hypothetical protein
MLKAFLAVVTLLASSIPLSAALADGPVHIKRTDPVGTTDCPSADCPAICNFNYHQEYQVSVNIKRFYDANGLVDHAIRQEDLWILHKNADTGLTYTEVDHYTLFLSDPAFCDPEHPANDCWWWQGIASSGQNWHLRDMDGKLVLVRSGRYIQDGNTGEILWATPKGDPDFVNIICKALGGAPAP